MFEHNTIEASNDTLMRQASMTAAEYLEKAIKEIDAELGAGYAKAHPELIGAFMQTAATDFGSAIIARAIQDGLAHLEPLTAAVREDRQGELAQAVQNIAAMIDLTGGKSNGQATCN